MASNNQGNKQDYDFVEQPDQDFYCPVSLEILLEPHQTLCCGHHISQEAANRLTREGKPCPMCKSEDLVTQVDKYFKRNTINKLKVRCPHKKSGCDWMGELGDLNLHSNSCPKRPWTCQHCNFDTIYEVGTSDHTPNCTKYPEPCPNCCEIGTVPRCDVEKHLLVCLLQLVHCEFAHAGCDVKVPRGDLAKHMTENAQHHLMSTTLLNLRLTRELHQKMEEKDQQIVHLQQQVKELNSKVRTTYQQQTRDIDTKLQQQTKDLDTKLQQQTKDLDTKLQQQTRDLDTQSNTKFQQQARDIDTKLQQQTKDLDTKLQQQTRDLDTQSNTKFQQQARDIDTKLQQLSRDLDTKLQQRTRDLDTKLHQQTKDLNTKSNTKLQTTDLNTNLQQQTRDLDTEPNTKLQQQTRDLDTKLQQRTRDDIKYDTNLQQQSTHLTQCMSDPNKVDEYTAPCFTSHDFNLTNFKKHQEKGGIGSWYSDPFYTYPGGYCFKLNVDTNGHGKSLGTHLSAYLYLLPGDYDKELKWPIKCTVHLEMLNQRGDHGHHTVVRTMEYGKVTTTCTYSHIGPSRVFYPLAELDHNAEKDIEYLQNDSLKFKMNLKIE